MSEDKSNLPAKAATTALTLPAAALERMQNKKYVDTFKPNELMIPWLQIVSSSSGFVKETKPTYIKEARPGDIIDTLSRRLRATQSIIIVKYDGVHYTSFEPDGGKFVKAWYTDPTAYNAANWTTDKKTGEERQFGSKIDADGNLIKPAATYYILAIDPETGSFAPMTMAWGSTQMGKSKRFNSLARAELIGTDGLPFIPPVFARIFDLGTKPEHNEKNEWHGWTYDVGGLVLANEKFGAGWYAAAESFREQIEKGNVRPMTPEDDAGGGDGNDGAEEQAPRRARGGSRPDDDIPY